MRQDPSGGTYGVCLFEDGPECEEWDYFRGDCKPAMYEHTEDSAGYVNLIREADLLSTVALDVLALSRDEASEPYVPLLTIDDAESLGAIVQALDVPLRRGLRVACIPICSLDFHLASGTTVAIEYSCGEDAGNFLRGGPPLTEGEDYAPPTAFNALMMVHIQSTWAEEIHPAQAYGLNQAIRLQILETAVSESGGTGTRVITAELASRHATDDPGLIAPLVETLDATYAFTNHVRCPAQYTLQFTLPDGSAENFGYLCHDGDLALFWGIRIPGMPGLSCRPPPSRLSLRSC